MTVTGSESKSTKEDIEWAQNFLAVNSLLQRCSNSERATLLLSTCRNAYLTLNALFADIQILAGDAVDASALRGACEIALQGGAPARARERFGRAILTVREFEAKRSVWQDRHAVWEDVLRAKSALAKVGGLVANRIDVILGEAVSESGEGWEHQLHSIDLQDRELLRPDFESLDRIFRVLRCCAELGYRIAIALEKEPQQKLDLGDSGVQEWREKTGQEVLALSKDLAPLCGWMVVETDEDIVVVLSHGYRRPRTMPDVNRVSLPCAPTREAIVDASRGMLLLVREALYFAHDDANRSFKANVAKPAMPPPFVIKLPPPEPVFDTSRTQQPRIVRVRCSADKAPPDVVPVALAHLAIPDTQLNGSSFRLIDKSIELIKRDIRLALQAASASGCRAIAFPEYSLPTSMIEEVLDYASREKIVIVGGLEGQWREGKLCDQAIVAIPGETSAHRQTKQQPSLDELDATAFFRDETISLFSNTPIGDFSVIVCSDWLQISTSQAWNAHAPLPDILFVVARNKYTDLYENFARTDCVRLYTCVVISNVCDGTKMGVATSTGSCVVVPHRTTPVVSGKTIAIDGKFAKAITVHDLPIKAVRARNRGKPERNFFSVPSSAKRT
jgi:predicted amidohydrolase